MLLETGLIRYVEIIWRTGHVLSDKSEYFGPQ